MALRTSRVTGTLTVTDEHVTSGTPPTIVGSGAVWNDDDDGTYAELATFEHPDVSYADRAYGVLEQVPNLSQNAETAEVFARIRYQSLDTDMGPPQVHVRRPASSPEYQLMMGAIDPPGAGSGAPTWVDLPLTDQTANGTGVALLLDHLKNSPGEVELHVWAPFLQTTPFRTPRTRIFEAYLVLKVVGDAPPCRLFPRADGLGVGSGRHFPPPKSRQRSGRRFGYY